MKILKPLFNIFSNNFENVLLGLSKQSADHIVTVWTAETGMDHQKVQNILQQKTLQDKMEDKILQWKIQISARLEKITVTVLPWR